MISWIRSALAPAMLPVALSAGMLVTACGPGSGDSGRSRKCGSDSGRRRKYGCNSGRRRKYGCGLGRRGKCGCGPGRSRNYGWVSRYGG